MCNPNHVRQGVSYCVLAVWCAGKCGCRMVCLLCWAAEQQGKPCNHVAVMQFMSNGTTWQHSEHTKQYPPQT
jgi:hypothetical protein